MIFNLDFLPFTGPYLTSEFQSNISFNGILTMRVRVYRPAKSAAQSGRAKTHQWVIEPEIVTSRKPDPIMGWASAGDTLGELKGRLLFASQEEAMAFLKRKGWEAVVEEPTERRIQPRNYLDNFRIVRPQDEERT